uniref:Uncharacterized protein n=1 Tax=uncultured marine virus TaxID=186617 RepID=A0A0F7L9E7_9VIRU|nr:hypothetical protein [uncultured marine virus]
MSLPTLSQRRSRPHERRANMAHVKARGSVASRACSPSGVGRHPIPRRPSARGP